MVNIAGYPLGPIQTNCYIIEEKNKQCLIIDPGEEAVRLIKEIDNRQLVPVAILLTHAHFDHIGAVEKIRSHYHVPVYIHEAEREWLSDPNLNGSSRYPGLPPVAGKPADHLIADDGPMEIGPFIFEVRHTPGHSPGSISFIFEDGNFAVVGDTLFQQSIGRTDLQGGNTETLLASIHDKLLSLDDDCVIYPGHGPSTTPGFEKDTNPFLNGF